MFRSFHCSKLILSNNIAIRQFYSFISSVPNGVLIHSKQCLFSPHNSCSPKIDGSFPKILSLSSFTTTVTPQILKKNKSKQSIAPDYDNDSYAISYLINTCGLSPERAKFASKTVKFKTPERPDSMLELLKNYEFNKAQISALIRIRPMLLLFNPQNTLLPKLEFFHSIGVSRVDVAKTLSRNPVLLERSLENQIIPFYNFLKGILGNSDEKVVGVFRSHTRVFYQDYLKNIYPNLAVLRELGVSESSIVLLMTNFPDTTTVKRDKFLKAVKEVQEMGFDPSKSYFVLALHALSGESNKRIWARCFEQYKKWGWTKEEIILAFEKHPNCMLLSETKIERTMDFLVNKFGRRSNEIARVPHIIGHSLEKRVIPRCSVINVLFSKGLVKKLGLGSILILTEDCFLKRYVARFEDQVPQLMSIYTDGKWTFGNANLDET